jgi:hypothetical protein
MTSSSESNSTSRSRSVGISGPSVLVALCHIELEHMRIDLPIQYYDADMLN